MTTELKEPSRLRDLKTGVRDLIMLDPRIIVVESGHNPRNYALPENRAHLDELKASIRANGTLNPLWVRWDNSTKTAILVDGECRLKANLELIEEGIEIVAVPTIQVTGGSEAQRLVLALTANTGKPLSKWEIGAAFQKLVAFGWDLKMIAEKMGYTVRYVSESMELSDAPEEIKALLSQQAVTPSLALSEIRKSGSGAVITLRAAVAGAAAISNGKTPAPAKRTKKSSGCTLSAEDADKIVAALQKAATQQDNELSAAAEAALAIFAEKGIKP